MTDTATSPISLIPNGFTAPRTDGRVTAGLTPLPTAVTTTRLTPPLLENPGLAQPDACEAGAATEGSQECPSLASASIHDKHSW